jgi:hypothetical protein
MAEHLYFLYSLYKLPEVAPYGHGDLVSSSFELYPATNLQELAHQKKGIGIPILIHLLAKG